MNDVVRSIIAAVAAAGPARVFAEVKPVLRYLSVHTGIPALVLSALLVCVGYRVLKRTARFAVEVAAVALLLVVASELGWIAW